MVDAGETLWFSEQLSRTLYILIDGEVSIDMHTHNFRENFNLAKIKNNGSKYELLGAHEFF